MIMKMISTFTPKPTDYLSDLKEGSTGVLAELDLSPRVAEHLMNLGFVPGVEITVSRSGPGGDPRIYRVDGAEVALRGDVARRIVVRRILRKTEN
jgi:ferrous iron transport protein A